MKRFRTIAGSIAGAILVASSVAHSFLEWRKLGAALAAARVPPDVSLAVAIGWHFAGVAMLTFGCIVILLFNSARGDLGISLRPALIIGLAYAIYGGWALAVTGLDPFFLVFLVPGLMLVAASWFPGRRGPRAPAVPT